MNPFSLFSFFLSHIFFVRWKNYKFFFLTSSHMIFSRPLPLFPLTHIMSLISWMITIVISHMLSVKELFHVYQPMKASRQGSTFNNSRRLSRKISLWLPFSLPISLLEFIVYHFDSTLVGQIQEIIFMQFGHWHL